MARAVQITLPTMGPECEIRCPQCSGFLLLLESRFLSCLRCKMAVIDYNFFKTIPLGVGKGVLDE